MITDTATDRPRHRIPIAIADVLVELWAPLSAAQLGIEARLGPFFGEPAAPAARVTLDWQESPGPLPTPPGRLVYDPGAIWRMYRDGADYYAAIAYQGEGSATAVLRADAAWERLTLTEWRSGPAWQSLLNIGASELILRSRLLSAGGLVLHAAALDIGGRGLVFVGHSGAGKSTQALLWLGAPGVTALSDDRVAVRLSDGLAMAYGTPWGGTGGIARNHRVPLAAMFLLEQWHEDDLARLPRSAALPLLSARAFLPYWDGDLLRRALGTLDALLTRVPTYRLRCRPTPDVIPLVCSVL